MHTVCSFDCIAVEKSKAWLNFYFQDSGFSSQMEVRKGASPELSDLKGRVSQLEAEKSRLLRGLFQLKDSLQNEANAPDLKIIDQLLTVRKIN